MEKRGIIVGADRKAEWMLPWWWKHYSIHASYPVTFIDFGLSNKGKDWCLGKGNLLPFNTDIAHIVEATSPPVGILDTLCGPTFRNHRMSWFKKPYACNMTPYKETIWIDTDCCLLKPIDSLFSFLTPTRSIALAREPDATQKNAKIAGLIDPEEVLYNSGVIVFQKNAKAIIEWEKILHTNETFPGDQDALSKAIYLNKIPIAELPSTYNWPWYIAFNPTAHIIHFMGDNGKDIIRKNIS